MMRRIFSIVLLFGIVSPWAYGQQQQPPAQAVDQAKPPEPQPPAAPEDAIDPYAKLRERVKKLENDWLQIEKEANGIIAKLSAENKCSPRIKPQIDRKRDAFMAYNVAYELYVQKQAADIKEDQGSFDKARADHASVPVDFKAEIAKLELDMDSIKSDLAKYPVDDPAYKDTREQLRENLTMDEESRSRYLESERKSNEASEQLKSAKAYSDARQQYADDVLKSVESIKIKNLTTYDSEAQLFTAICLKSKKIDH